MTLAIPEPTPAAAEVDSWIPVLADVAQLATRIAETEFVPKGLRGSVPAVAAAILYGREVGLPPMTALSQTHVIEGKPAMSAEAMRAMVLAAGHDLIVEETTGALCTMRARRRGSEHWTSLTWSLDMARAAGVAGKNVWKSYPRQMLQARCTTELVRLVFPDVIHGFRSIEELEDMGDSDIPGTVTAVQETSKVARKRATAKKAAPPALERPAERPETTGPPLPGEDGYEASAPATKGHGRSVGSEGEGEAPDEPTDTPDSLGSLPEVEGSGGADSPGARPPVAPPAEPTDPNRGPRKASPAQKRMVLSLLGGLGVDNSVREERLHITSQIVGRTVPTYKELLHSEAHTLVETLGRLEDKQALNDLLDAIDAQANTEQENQDGD